MKRTVQKYSFVVFGSMLVGFSISVFYTPNKIVSGGVSGITTLLYHTLHISPGLSYAVINLLLLLIALRPLGKGFVLNTVLGAGLLSVFVQLFSYLPPATGSTLLAAVFGAFFTA